MQHCLAQRDVLLYTYENNLHNVHINIVTLVSFIKDRYIYYYENDKKAKLEHDVMTNGPYIIGCRLLSGQGPGIRYFGSKECLISQATGWHFH